MKKKKKDTHKVIKGCGSSNVFLVMRKLLVVVETEIGEFFGGGTVLRTFFYDTLCLRISGLFFRSGKIVEQNTTESFIRKCDREFGLSIFVHFL